MVKSRVLKQSIGLSWWEERPNMYFVLDDRIDINPILVAIFCTFVGRWWDVMIPVLSWRLVTTILKSKDLNRANATITSSTCSSQDGLNYIHTDCSSFCRTYRRASWTLSWNPSEGATCLTFSASDFGRCFEVQACIRCIGLCRRWTIWLWWELCTGAGWQGCTGMHSKMISNAVCLTEWTPVTSRDPMAFHWNSAI